MVNQPSSHERRTRAVSIFASGLLTMGAAWAQAPFRGNPATKPVRQIAAQNTPFPSRAAAQNFIAEALPRVTAANPEYLSKSGGVRTRWLTKSVGFEDAPAGLEVSMDEEYTKTKAGAVTVGAHRAVFLLAAVEISATVEPDDLTPDGKPAMGILFKCVAPKCVSATWDGRAEPSDSTDISVQDDALRARLIAAFQTLKGFDRSAG